MKYYSIAPLLCALILLGGCSYHPPTTTMPESTAYHTTAELPTQPPTEGPSGDISNTNTTEGPQSPSTDLPLNIYRSVLLDGAEFFSTDDGKNMSLMQLLEASTSDPIQISQFTVVDLDGDGTQEVILWMATSETSCDGFEVLHNSHGDVYGYALTYRMLQELKVDGTFYVSGGAYDYGYGIMKFDESTWTVDRLTSCESSFDVEGTETQTYYVKGEISTEEDFDTSVEQQILKADVSWYDYTDSNIKKVL